MSDALSAEQVAEPLSAALRRAITDEPTHDERGVASNYYDRLAARLTALLTADEAYQNKYGDRLAALPAKPDVGERLRTAETEDWLADAIDRLPRHYEVRHYRTVDDDEGFGLVSGRELAQAILRAALTEQEAGRE